MKTLLLIRHAKSSWKDPGLEDHARPLNKRGTRDAPDMGQRLDAWLRAHNAGGPDLWLSSSAERAQATSRLIAREITVETPSIEFTGALYTFDPEVLLGMIQRFEPSVQKAWIVGHNPAIEELAEWLTGRVLPKVPTCALLQIRLEAPRWREVAQHGAELVWFDYPKSTRAGLG
ncbi:histidine phosphatase family protein [Motiliproteus sp. SC1-56]|uniref:SixA phosphatase family protein n=1 Tax=Motiliproteus sp. SC1-56 TaxID=2799565 RepID=UPI001A9077CF|nr:histidine phosphatase family protein [Motiliproteus sp. SC1-56]